MRDDPSNVTAQAEEEMRARHAQLLRSATLVSRTAAALSLLVFGGIYFAVPAFRGLPLIVINVGTLVCLQATLIFLSRNRLPAAQTAYFLGMGLAVLIGIRHLGGVTGPVPMLYVVLSLIAGLVGDARLVARVVIFNAVGYGLLLVLELTGILLPVPLVISPSFFHAMILVISLGIVVLVITQFVRQMEHSMQVASERGEALVEASLRAEESARAEYQARRREELRARRLRQTVREYVAFLQRITEGDYGVTLDLEDEEEGADDQLVILGRYLQETVESLLSALRDLREVQRRYMREAWEKYLDTSLVQAAFRQSGDGVTSDPTAWLPSMGPAVQAGRVAVDGGELSVPLTHRGQVIGAVGLRRDDGEEWRPEEVAAVEVIADQMAQTIDNLRLLDETQRRAERERMTGSIAAEIRGASNLEGVLETAAQRLGRALGLEEVVIELAPEKVEE
jgi:GAF domain-containing protein